MQVQKSLAALVLCCLSAGLGAQPRPNPRPHYKALCLVDNQSRVRCVTIDDLKRLLSPAELEKLQKLLDDLFPQITGRLGSAKNTLTSCGHGDWTQANLSIPPSPSGPPRGATGSGRRLPLFRPPRTSSSSSRSATRRFSPTSMPLSRRRASGKSKFVKDTVAQMDAAVANCRDQSSPVAAGSGASGYTDARDRYGNAVKAVKQTYSPQDVVDKKPGAERAYAALYDAEGMQKLLDAFFDSAQTDKGRGRPQGDHGAPHRGHERHRGGA